MDINKLKTYVIGFLLGVCMLFLLGATRIRLVDGHCQSSLSGVGYGGEVYLAITNTSTGKTIVRRLDESNLTRGQEIILDATSINSDRLIINIRQ